MLAGERLAAEDRRVRNIVFMGMGEPFHNEETLYEVVAALLAPELFHHPPRRILISTVGIPDAMIRCARRFPDVNLALSLHSVRQNVREQLIPLAAKYPLDELRDAVAAVNRDPAEHGDDRVPDARRPQRFARRRPRTRRLAHRPRRPRESDPLQPDRSAPQLRSTDRADRDAFAAILRDAGFVTTIRYSLGADIAAACGQLVQSENRQIARQQAAASNL